VEGGYRGTALNLAARLCSLAGPGEIPATETVTNLARKVDGLTYADRGTAQLKGFADPVKVLRIQPSEAPEEVPATDSHPSAIPHPATVSRPVHRKEGDPESTREMRVQVLPIGGFLGSLPDGPLVAREADLGQILAAVDKAAAGQGQTVLLAGEPGAGKTRLAAGPQAQAMLGIHDSGNRLTLTVVRRSRPFGHRLGHGHSFPHGRL